jgi:hypothetical protein
MSDPGPGRKKPRRMWLLAPYAVLAALALGYGGYWFWATTGLEKALDQRAEAMRRAGYTVDIDGRHVDGFPFRLRLVLPNARIASPAGWGLSAPGFEAQAYLHDIGHWVLVAPQGLTVTRPHGGPVTVSGQALRASAAGLGHADWRIVAEGVKLVFTPGAGAAAFSLAGAERLQVNVKPGAAALDEALFLVQLEGGKAAPAGALHRLTGGAAITAVLDGKFTKADTFRGASLGDAARTWSSAGGQLQIVRGEAHGGTAAIWARGGTLSASRDGHVEGAIPLELRQAAQSLAALSGQALDADAAHTAATVAAAREQGGSASLSLVFQAGVATLGPVQIGPAPRVF